MESGDSGTGGSFESVSFRTLMSGIMVSVFFVVEHEVFLFVFVFYVGQTVQTSDMWCYCCHSNVWSQSCFQTALRFVSLVFGIISQVTNDLMIILYLISYMLYLIYHMSYILYLSAL